MVNGAGQLAAMDAPTLHPWPELAHGHDGTVRQDQAEVKFQTTSRLRLRFLDLLDGAPVPEYPLVRSQPRVGSGGHGLCQVPGRMGRRGPRRE